MAAHQTFARRPDALSPERSSSASNLGRIAFLTVDQSFFCREDQWMLRLLLPTHESKGKRSSKLLRPPAFADRFYPCSPPSPLAPILTPVLLALRQPAWRAWASTESCQDMRQASTTSIELSLTSPQNQVPLDLSYAPNSEDALFVIARLHRQTSCRCGVLYEMADARTNLNDRSA